MKNCELVDCLAAFNRKERYWLLRNALSEPGPAPRLSHRFRTGLSEVIGKVVPPDAWWAMDFHVDWVIGALTANRLGWEPAHATEFPNFVKDAKPVVSGKIEDFDFVVAFESTLILVEAKAFGSWSLPQLDSKRARLEGMLDERMTALGTPRPGHVRPDIHLVLTSPARSPKVRDDYLRTGDGWEFGSSGFMIMNLDEAPDRFVMLTRKAGDPETPLTDAAGTWQLKLASRAPNTAAPRRSRSTAAE